jgi:hypothetical protein
MHILKKDRYLREATAKAVSMKIQDSYSSSNYQTLQQEIIQALAQDKLFLFLQLNMKKIS